MLKNLPTWVDVDPGLKADEDVFLGYLPESKISNLRLTVGKNARIRSGTVIYAGSKIGDNLETGHNVIIREENEIGCDLSIWSNSVIDYGCKIGDYVKIHSNCYIAQYTILEDHVFLAPGVVIANDLHPGCKFSKKCMKGPTLQKYVQVGINATILPFVIIREHSIIGAGSVVTKNIPPRCVAYGNPATVVGSIYDIKCVKGFTDKPYARDQP